MIRCCLRLLSLFLLIAAFDVSTAGAQVTGSVSGSVVTADTGEPVAGAIVRLVELGREVSSDGAGRYRMEEVPVGSYTLEVTALGRLLVRREVVVTAGRSVVGGIALQPRAIGVPAIRVVLDPQRIVGSEAAAASIPGSAHFIGSEDLARRRLLYNDVHQIGRASCRERV